jgi:histidine ammonia-lyase
MAKLVIDGSSLTFNDIEKFLTHNIKVEISPSALKKVKKSRALIEKWVSKDEVIYGVTTGFGEFANVKIPPDKIRELQENLILSHAAGCGDDLPPFIVKIMMLLRVNALAKGNSGIRPETLTLLTEMINRNIIPVVPSQGSVGSSGDLVQLSHLVLAMIGKGRVQEVSGNIFDPANSAKEILQSSPGVKEA